MKDEQASMGWEPGIGWELRLQEGIYKVPFQSQVGFKHQSGVLMGLWGCCLPAGQLPPHTLRKPTPPIEMPQFFGRHLIV